MVRREDLTDEFEPLDLPGPPSSSDPGEHTLVVDLDELGSPTETMDRRDLRADVTRHRGEKAPATAMVVDETVPPTVAPETLVATESASFEAIHDEGPPASERTVFGSYEPTDLPPPSQRNELAQRPSFRELSASRRQLVDVRPFSRLDDERTAPRLDDTALLGDEHTSVSLGTVTPEATAAPSARRPPPPPSGRMIPAPSPRRPAGLPAPGQLPEPPPATARPNPFLPPPSKFFQQPTGPGRSKPRESTIDIDPDDLPPPSSAERAPLRQSSISMVREAPRSAGSIQHELERIPGLMDTRAVPDTGRVAPLARPPLGMPPPPPRVGSALPKAVATYREDAPFDLDLEALLLERKDWPRLVELYSSSASRDEGERLQHLVQAASILHEQLAEYERSFFTFLDALVLSPDLPEAAIGIERAAHALGVHSKSKWSEATRRLKKISDQAGDPALRAGYLALLFRWNNQELRRRDIAAEVFSRLSEIAPGHPTVLERKANEARARGDTQQQRQLLDETLPLLTRPDDRIRVHLALAELLEGPLAARGQALPHYEAVLEESPNHFDALRGLERALREAGDPARLRDVLDRMVAAAASPKERLEPLIRLAETLEKELVDPDAAASVLEEALLIDGQNAKALAALERCYEALGHWSEVARVMQRRAGILTAPRAKMDLLFAAGDVLEKRAYDLESALEAYRMVLTVDAKNRRALGELRRLAETLSMLDEAISFGARLAEVTPDKREAARIYEGLGQELEHRSEPQLARTQYERALELDPRNRPVHAALERLARSGGADERARHFLERRAKLTDDKAEAAELYTQLGRERREAGDFSGALEAYGAAHTADPTGEEAAAALLDWHVEQGNFRAIEPLLGPLVAAARREQDGPRTLHMLRLATRTAASLGKMDQALHAAMAAYDEAETDAGARSDLLEVATRTSPDKIGIAREHLARVAKQAEGISTGGLVRLAEAQYAAGDARHAITTLEQAHDQSPNDTEPLEALEKIFEAEEMWERLAVIKIEHARMLPLAEEDLHFRLLADAGDMWARRLNDVRAASEAFEEARVLRPDDGWLLETLAWAYREVEEWPKLAEVLATLSDGAETPDKARELLLELAALYAEELGDPASAAAALDRILDASPGYLQAFEKLVRMLTDRRDWNGLEKSYRKMLLRAKGSASVALELALWKQLGLVYRDRLGNNDHALEAFQAALTRNPADEELHRIVVELNLLLGDLDGAIAQARRRVQYAPFEAATYSALHDLFLRRGSYDLAWCAVDVMAQLVPLEGEEEELYAGYPPFPLDEIPGTLTEEAWQTHLLDKEMDATLTSLFAWATPAEVRLLERSSSYLGTRPFDQSTDGAGGSLTAIIENGAEILGMVNPPLYYAENAETPLRPAAAPPGAFLVDHERALQERETLAFHVGRGLSWLRSELMPLAFFANAAELASFLSRLVRQDPDVYFAMTEDERQTVSVIIDQATEDAAKFDVRRWLVLAHASSVRAAVLLSGSVHDAAVFYSRAEGDEHASEKLTAVYQFAVSEEHTELRTAIGTAISQTT